MNSASNAFMIWYPEFVGGAEASQKGFGDFIPARFVDKFGMVYFFVFMEILKFGYLY